VLQCVAVYSSVLQNKCMRACSAHFILKCAAASVLQCVWFYIHVHAYAVCILYFICTSDLGPFHHRHIERCSEILLLGGFLKAAPAYFILCVCVAVRCSVLQCVLVQCTSGELTLQLCDEFHDWFFEWILQGSSSVCVRCIVCCSAMQWALDELK